LSDTCHRLAVGVTIVGGGGDLALTGARAGPCDDEDKMCCLTERENEKGDKDVALKASKAH
jgi:hypothetical protein